MKASIDHFMWGYQPHFRIYMEVAAKAALDRLDNRLDPKVFLVGVLSASAEGLHKACVEPENDWWIESEAFDNVLDLATELEAANPESQVFHSHPIASARAADSLRRRSIRDAILKTIEVHPRRPADLTYYASVPVSVGPYFVSVILSLRRQVLESYYRLSSDALGHVYREWYVGRSLIDTTADEILKDGAEQLQRPDPGSNSSDREGDEVVRSAARTLTRGLGFRVDQSAISGFHNLFQTCNQLSGMTYERVEGRGRLLLARKNHPNVQPLLSFSEEIRLSDLRRTRKLLELAVEGSALHTNSEAIFGLAPANTEPGTTEDLFSVRFLEKNHWEVLHGEHVLLRVAYGEPQLPKAADFEGRIRSDLPRIFPAITPNAVSLISSLVRTAEKLGKGSLVVVSAKAQSEAQRLKAQATLIEPRVLTPSLLSQLLGIDGALLLDPEGNCHAIGVILDGTASEYGNPARGARYNSAVRYVSSALSSDIPTLAVIVSDDGGVDFVPNLRPRVKRSDIDARIRELEQIETAMPLPWKRFNEAFDWLDKKRFYLLASDCERINGLGRSIEDRDKKEDPDAIRIVRKPFSPVEGMDPKLFYESE